VSKEEPWEFSNFSKEAKLGELENRTLLYIV